VPAAACAPGGVQIRSSRETAALGTTASRRYPELHEAAGDRAVASTARPHSRAALRLHDPLIDLTDVPTRQQIENRHAELLLEYDLPHLES
jgi:hypothetical protein